MKTVTFFGRRGTNSAAESIGEDTTPTEIMRLRGTGGQDSEEQGLRKDSMDQVEGIGPLTDEDAGYDQPVFTLSAIDNNKDEEEKTNNNENKNALIKLLDRSDEIEMIK